MSKIVNGMIFKNIKEMCEVVGIKDTLAHPDRINKKLSYFCEWHKSGKKYIIDKVFENAIEFKEHSLLYLFNIGDILNIKNTQVKILNQTRYGSKNRKAYKCECLKCKSILMLYEYNLNESCCEKCAIDSGNVPIRYNNRKNLWETNPEIAKLLKNYNDGYLISKGSHKKVDFVCDRCNSIVESKTVRDVVNSGLSCQFCSDGISYPNKFMYNLLTQFNIHFEKEYSPDWIKPKRYDFYFELNNKKYIVEMDGGIGHGNNNTLSNLSSEESILIDEYKDKIAKEHNIIVIRINCNPSKYEQIKKNILHSNLSVLFNLSNIDWIKIEKESQTSLFYETCRFWNNKLYDVNIIANILNISTTTVNTYLQRGTKLKFCDYSKILTKEIAVNKFKNTLYQKDGRPFICNENGYIFGKVSLCSNFSDNIFSVHLYASGIYNVLNKKYMHTNGFTFTEISKSQFNIYKKEGRQCFGDFFILPEETQVS